ncbi:hypothetical protein K435DRAFT_380345 [Dendrothele bispora CBS 962.96]|uniref:DUF6535 domain-containing protein n=1 Tax=Dendrothele bispora (strain CBS 962.96) TaxID=1314807 RepID=A0A4S8MWF2_DENBC|nr:hypothetical protein K435DRAFT_380345 [Dendrothele bispora CBS 962.96]
MTLQALNGSIPIGTFSIELPTFQPSASSIICNMLWFLSLVLALTCSLLATFVQQWTRDFIHKTTLHPSPVRRARVIAFMYFGLRDFGMHTFVDVIPILLHLSLIFFFTGLIGFLWPVNGPLTYLMVAVLISFLALYIGLTFLPLFHLDSPYRTPMSGVLWHFVNAVNFETIGGFFAKRHELERRDYSLTQAMLAKSLHNTIDRDQQAMVFAMKSLNDDNELLPFIEAIPDALYDLSGTNSLSGSGVRSVHHHLLMSLLESTNPEVNIVSRITQFISKSNHWSESNAFRERSARACPKALWSIAFMLIHEQGHLSYTKTKNRIFGLPPKIYWFERETIRAMYHSQDFLQGEYVKSAAAAMHLSRMYSLRYCVGVIEGMLTETVPFNILTNTNSYSGWQDHLRSRFSKVLEIWSGVGLESFYGLQTFSDLCKSLLRILQTGSTSPSPYEELIEADEVIRVLKEESTWKPMRLSILSGYLHAATHSLISTGRLPHEFTLMCQTIYPKNLDSVSVDLNTDATNDEAALVDTITSPLRLLRHSLEEGHIPVFSEKTDALLSFAKNVRKRASVKLLRNFALLNLNFFICQQPPHRTTSFKYQHNDKNCPEIPINFFPPNTSSFYTNSLKMPSTSTGHPEEPSPPFIPVEIFSE